MNIEIANRLVNLRKTNNLSQEALAEKLGISRQAVSKWERAEASPDTDNLILLARLYGVSLDELLKTEEEITVPETAEASDNYKNSEEKSESEYEEEDPEYVHVGLGGVHVKDKDGSEVHVGWDGIHIDDRNGNEDIHIDKNGVYINGRKYDRKWMFFHHFPFGGVIIILYLVMGAVFNAWHPAWLLFLLIPLWHTFIEAVRNRNAYIFAYPVLAALIYLCIGFLMNAWHPGWLIFLTIPLYYPSVGYIQSICKEKEYEEYNSPYGDR